MLDWNIVYISRICSNEQKSQKQDFKKINFWLSFKNARKKNKNHYFLLPNSFRKIKKIKKLLQSSRLKSKLQHVNFKAEILILCIHIHNF